MRLQGRKAPPETILSWTARSCNSASLASLTAGGVRTGLDTLRQQMDPEIESEYYHVKVKADADPEALKLALLRETGDRLGYEVEDNSEEAREIGSLLMPPIYTFTGALLAIGAVNLLITLLFTVRERYRDFSILKTLGLTPRQIAASVATTAGLMAIIALVIGTPIGFILTRLLLNPNPPKDTDGRREDSGRGWVRELQGRWPGVLG